MSGVFTDSDRHCPRCGKRMMLDIGQDDGDDPVMVGWTRLVHECWNCDYREIDENWPRPKLVLVSDTTGAQRLAKVRLGEIPLRYDPTPFPAGEFDDAPRDAS